MNATVTEVSRQTEAPLADLLLRLWAHKWSAFIIPTIFVLLGIGYLNVATYKYTATLILAPAEQSAPQIPGGLAGLGSLVGIDLASQQGSSFSLFTEAVKSSPVAEALSNDRRIMTTIFKDEWNGGAGRFEYRPSSTRALTDAIKAILGMPRLPWREPSAITLENFIEQKVSVNEDKKKSIITIAFDHEDPEFARYFVERIYVSSDNFLRRKALARASTYVTYLEMRLQQVAVSEYRESLAQALGSYEKTRMMASSGASFAAEKFGDVTSSTKPTTPQPIVTLLISGICGILAWIVYVFALYPAVGNLRRRRLASAG